MSCVLFFKDTQKKNKNEQIETKIRLIICDMCLYLIIQHAIEKMLLVVGNVPRDLTFQSVKTV